MSLPPYSGKLAIWLSVFLLPLTSLSQYKFYFGNIHAHTSYSDGCKDCADNEIKTPKDCFRFAKQSQHLNFLGISEHNHNVQGVGMHLENYAKGLDQADEENDDGNFVCMYGIEFGLNSHGHVLVYGMKKLPGWEPSNFDVLCNDDDYSRLWTLINDAKAFATLAHPLTPQFNKLRTASFKSAADKAICGVAIANGPHDSEAKDYSEREPLEYYGYYQTILSRGYHAGPTIDHDNHNITFGRTSHSRTVVLARKLNRDSIIAAYKAMRFYASDDWDTEVTMTIKSRPMGSIISTKTDAIIRVNIDEPSESDPVDYIKIMYGKPGSGVKPKALASVAGSNFIVAPHTGVAVGETYYYYAEIAQKDKDMIITSPIWVKKIN